MTATSSIDAQKQVIRDELEKLKNEFKGTPWENAIK